MSTKNGERLDEDIDRLMRVIRRAMCLRVEAVRNAVVLEHDPGASKSKRTHLSRESGLRESQYRHLNWRAVRAFEEAGLKWESVALRGEWVVPYRRKCFAEVTNPSLRRVNEVVCRLQDGLLRSMVQMDFDSEFATSEGRALARALLAALTQWDYPAIAELALQYTSLLRGMRDVLGVTEDELLLMLDLESDAWRDLGSANSRYDAFYQFGSSRLEVGGGAVRN